MLTGVTHLRNCQAAATLLRSTLRSLGNRIQHKWEMCVCSTRVEREEHRPALDARTYNVVQRNHVFTGKGVSINTECVTHAAGVRLLGQPQLRAMLASQLTRGVASRCAQRYKVHNLNLSITNSNKTHHANQNNCPK
jgi:hypothetical protein